MAESQTKNITDNLGEKIAVSMATLAGTTLVTMAAGAIFPPAAPFAGALVGPFVGLAAEKMIENFSDKKNDINITHHTTSKKDDESLVKSKVQNHEHSAHKDLGPHTHQIIQHEQQNHHENVR